LRLIFEPAANWGEGLVRVLRLFGVVVAFPLLAAVPAVAQSSTAASSASQLPLHGFIPPFEILRTVRAAGFDPLAPPLRQGTTYVVRAMDFRGVAMRLVVDARSGVIRDANRIVSGPGLYGPYAPGPYAPGPYAPGPYEPAHYGRLGPPPTYLRPPDELAVYGARPYIGAAEIPSDDPDELRSSPLRAPRSIGSALVPLPRPRPAGLAAVGTIESKPASKPDFAKPDMAKPDMAKPDMTVGGATPPRSDGSTKAAKGSAPPLIND
jgi:hypothetical protein